MIVRLLTVSSESMLPLLLTYSCITNRTLNPCKCCASVDRLRSCIMTSRPPVVHITIWRASGDSRQRIRPDAWNTLWYTRLYSGREQWVKSMSMLTSSRFSRIFNYIVILQVHIGIMPPILAMPDDRRQETSCFSIEFTT